MVLCSIPWRGCSPTFVGNLPRRKLIHLGCDEDTSVNIFVLGVLEKMIS